METLHNYGRYLETILDVHIVDVGLNFNFEIT